MCSKSTTGECPQKKHLFFANQVEEKIPTLEVFVKGEYLILFFMNYFFCKNMAYDLAACAVIMKIYVCNVDMNTGYLVISLSKYISPTQVIKMS